MDPSNILGNHPRHIAPAGKVVHISNLLIIKEVEDVCVAILKVKVKLPDKGERVCVI